MKQRQDTPLREDFNRTFDVLCAAAGLVLLLPVFAALALLILWDDGRPVFFSQTRMGRNGEPFRIWKFRTMRAGSSGSLVTAAGDQRVTRAGAVLRKRKLDELPQLFNVLKGDMSIVGPRPEVPQYVRLETPVWQAVLQVRPGITDPASLLYRDEEQILGAARDPNAFYREKLLPAKLLLNLDYLRARSFRQDLRLIFATLRYALFRETLNPDFVQRTFSCGTK